MLTLQGDSADKVSTATRSWIMSRVPSKNTSAEIAARKILHAAGYRFRIHRSDLPGKPDIVLPRYKVAIMVHGCLWHGHGCRRFRWPVSNAHYWRKKIGRNVERDRVNQISLNEKGWSVKVVWDCNLKESLATLIDELEQIRAKKQLPEPFMPNLPTPPRTGILPATE